MVSLGLIVWVEQLFLVTFRGGSDYNIMVYKVVANYGEIIVIVWI